MSEPIEFEVGSGNVFADLGLPNADEHLLKAQLVQKISRAIKERNLTQAATASLLGIAQPDVSNMLRGQFRRISVEKLLHHLVALGHDVQIVVKPHHDSQRAAQLSVA